MATPGRVGRPYRRLCARLRARREPCSLCGQPIDYDAPPRTRWSFSLDHINPITRGGAVLDPTNAAPAHYGCNSRKGNGQRTPAGNGYTSPRW